MVLPRDVVRRCRPQRKMSALSLHMRAIWRSEREWHPSQGRWIETCRQSFSDKTAYPAQRLPPTAKGTKSIATKARKVLTAHINSVAIRAGMAHGGEHLH